MSYQVFDNNRPAQHPYCDVHESWDNSTFDTFEEAHAYALEWLGFYNGSGITIQLNAPYDYSGFGDNLEIRQVS